MRRRLFIGSVIGLAITAACKGGRSATLTELQRIRSGALDIVLLSQSGALRHGKDQVVIEFRSAADGSLVDVGDVQGSATMPMAGMPMLGTIDVRRSDVAGRYLVSTQLEMAGTWRTTITWTGPAGPGSVTISATAQ